MDTKIDSRRKLYEGSNLANFRELVNIYKNVYADKVAFKYKLNADVKKYTEKTYTEFAHDIESLGSFLLNLKLQNKRVAIIGPNRYEWCVSYLAVTTSNIVVVPLDKSLPKNEIINSIIRSEADAVIFDKDYLSTFSELYKNNNSNLKYFICMDNIEFSDLDIIYYSDAVKEYFLFLQHLNSK